MVEGQADTCHSLLKKKRKRKKNEEAKKPLGACIGYWTPNRMKCKQPLTRVDVGKFQRYTRATAAAAITILAVNVQFFNLNVLIHVRYIA
jgi:ABC-type proline/glycine betaine transport system substrate-binding protein